MHIAFIIESDYNSGGMERMLSIMANRLAAWFDITILTAFNEGRAPFFTIADTVRQVDLGLGGWRRTSLRTDRMYASLSAVLSMGSCPTSRMGRERCCGSTSRSTMTC